MFSSENTKNSALGTSALGRTCVAYVDFGTPDATYKEDESQNQKTRVSHSTSEVFGFATHTLTGVNTMSVQQVGASGTSDGPNFCRHGAISAETVLPWQRPESFRDAPCFTGSIPRSLLVYCFAMRSSISNALVCRSFQLTFRTRFERSKRTSNA